MTIAMVKGVTVAHVLAMRRALDTNDPAILCLADEKGVTVAHLLAWQGRLRTNDYDILAMRDHNGWTVARALAVFRLRRSRGGLTETQVTRMERKILEAARSRQKRRRCYALRAFGI